MDLLKHYWTVLLKQAAPKSLKSSYVTDGRILSYSDGKILIDQSSVGQPSIVLEIDVREERKIGPEIDA